MMWKGTDPDTLPFHGLGLAQRVRRLLVNRQNPFHATTQPISVKLVLQRGVNNRADIQTGKSNSMRSLPAAEWQYCIGK